MGKLDETENFIALHIHSCGKSEVPEIFQRWACLSMIGAAVADRVWLMKMGKKLHPNMYTFLIGPSGLGKGEAIDAVGGLARRVPGVNWLRVKRTAAGLLDKMAQYHINKNKEKIYKFNKLFLVMPELGMAIGTGRTADDFIKHMTDMYSGSGDTLDEGTRTSGTHAVPSPCLNWLVGTTKEWLMSSITKDALYGGFIARTACVQADYNLDIRYDEPWMPPDRDEVLSYLYARLVKLTRITGLEMKLSGKARELIRHWYLNREAPDVDDPLMPSWKREHDFILKLSMILALADDMDTIKSEHFIEAEKLSRGLQTRMPELITYASVTPQTEALQRASAILRRAKSMPQDLLLRRLGITADQFRDVSDTLQTMRLVKISKVKNLYNPTFIWSETHLDMQVEE